MKFFVIYESLGVMWWLFNVFAPMEMSVRYREALVRTWSEASSKTRVLGIIVGVLGMQFWPATLAWSLMPGSWTPRLTKLFMTYWRRTILDRPGFLQPQMPAPQHPTMGFIGGPYDGMSFPYETYGDSSNDRRGYGVRAPMVLSFAHHVAHRMECDTCYETWGVTDLKDRRFNYSFALERPTTDAPWALFKPPNGETEVFGPGSTTEAGRQRVLDVAVELVEARNTFREETQPQDLTNSF